MDLQTVDLIKVIVPSAASIVTGAAILVKAYFDNKKKSKADEKRDERMSARIDKLENKVSNVEITNSRIENDVKELTELHKYTRFSRQINAIITSNISNIIESRNVENEEIKQIFFTAANRFKKVYSEILDSNFEEIEPKKVMTILKIEAKSVRSQINIEKLNTNNVHAFLNEMKETCILPRFTEFANDLAVVTDSYENGVRREKFKALCLFVVNSVVNDCITIYQKYAK